MREIYAIATYLIVNNISSSQSMAKWLMKLHETWVVDKEFLESGRYHEFVRWLFAQKIITENILSNLLQYTLWKDEAEEFIEKLEQRQIRFFIISDENFPQELRDIYDPPGIIFTFGNIDLLRPAFRKITIVGTRTPSNYAIMRAKQFTYESVKCELVIVSGLASGVDQFCHREALDRNGKTIAVVPQLTEEMIKEVRSYPDRILLVSEFPPCENKVAKWQYVTRNRLSAALSPYTIVVEAPIRSGTLITADFALMYGKSVYVVLPDPTIETSYGGILLAQSLGTSIYVQSIYEVFYFEEDEYLMGRYRQFINELSGGKILIEDTDSRHLAEINCKRLIYESQGRDLDKFSTAMVELHRFGIIRERKEKIVINFAGYELWPKI